MPGLDAIPAEWQPLASILFVVAIVVFGAWSRIFGKKQGAEQPKVQEFYAAGQMSDMGPVRELVEGVGLLFQQQVKTNLALEANAKASSKAAVAQDRLADAFEEYLAELRKANAERDMAEEIDRESDRKARILAEDIVRRREEAEAAERRPPRKST